MGDMKTLEFKGDYGNRYYGSYDDLVESFGFGVVVRAGEEDYQGTYFYLLKDGGRYGTLDVSYGSCSGCDSLQACDTPEEVTALRDDLFDTIKWYDSTDRLVEELIAREVSSYHWRDQEADEFLKHLPRLMFGDHTAAAIRDVSFPVAVLNDMLIEDGCDQLATAIRMKGDALTRLRGYVESNQ